MGELAFYGVGAPAAHFVEEGAGGGTEAVAGHFNLRKTHPPQY